MALPTAINMGSLPGSLPLSAARHAGWSRDNGLPLNAHLMNTWRSQRVPLLVPGRGWGIKTTVVDDLLEPNRLNRQGWRVNSLGSPWAFAEGQRYDYINAGAWVWTNEQSNVGPIHRVSAYGNVYDGLTFVGRGVKGDLGVLQSASRDADVQLGLHFVGENGRGKHKLLGCVFAACQVAVQTGGGVIESEATDQLYFDVLRTPYCGVGLRTVNHQSVGHKIGQYEGVQTPLMIDMQRGGKLEVDQATLIHPGGTFLRTGGLFGGNETNYTVVEMAVDYAAGGDCVVWDQTAVAAQKMAITSLEMCPDIDYLDTFRLNAYSQLTVLSGCFLNEWMVRVIGGNLTFMPKFTFSNCSIKHGQDFRNMINPLTSSGYAEFRITDCCDAWGGFVEDKWYRWYKNPAAGHENDEPTIEELPR